MKNTIIKPSAAIRQNYNETSGLSFDQFTNQLALRERLVEIEERRIRGVMDSAARDFVSEMRSVLEWSIRYKYLIKSYKYPI